MRRLAVLVLAGVVIGAACSSGGGSADDQLAQQRADQARAAALNAGLSSEVGDFLALLGSSVTSSYQVTYPATEGAGSLVVSQSPPDHRVDITDGRDLLESHIIRDDASYRCVPPKGAKALRCTRSGSGDAPGGAFTPEALASTTDQLVAAAADYDLAVSRRTIAGARATCLTTTRKPGRPAPTDGAIDGRLCVSPEGVVLSVVRGDQHVEATGYTLEVPKGTFDLPDRG
jgi:hypothetical protein